MAELTFQEKRILEKLLNMESGYVSNFSNRTIQLFIGDFNIDIYDNKYTDNGDSKANRLRTLFKKESDYTVSLIIEALLNYQMAVDIVLLGFGEQIGEDRRLLYSGTNRIISRLKNSAPVENISAIRPVEADTNFTLLAESVRRSIENHNPIEALDRLHTYMVRYSRKLCEKRSIVFTNADALNGLFGAYVRHLRENNLVTSTMTFEILGSYVKILDKYNSVRNNESLAHDNNLVNDSEALLILNSVANLIRFVDELERNLTD